MLDYNCEICEKPFSKKDSYIKHKIGRTLCLKDINCKELYLENIQLKTEIEDYIELNAASIDENKKLKETISELNNKLNNYDILKDRDIMHAKNEILELQMKDVIQSKSGVINNNSNIINNYIVVSDPTPFNQIDWDLSEIDIDFVRAGPKPLIKFIEKNTRIHTEQDGTKVLNYCNSDITRDSFSKLNDQYVYEKDAGGNQFTEKVLYELLQPHYNKILSNKYPGYPNDRSKLMKLSPIQQQDACDTIQMGVMLFEKGSDPNKALMKGLRSELYMSLDTKQRVKFNNTTPIPVIDEVIEVIEEQEYLNEYVPIDSSIVEDLYPNEPEIISDSD
jgi:hypothetical protein